MMMRCPKCGFRAEYMETQECFWYQCTNPGCGHALTYDEAVEAEKRNFDEWADAHKVVWFQ